MKRIFASALMILLTIGAANAQTTQSDKKEGAKKEHRQHHKDLNLTEAQKAKMAELRARHKLEREAAKGDRKELMQRHRAEMQAILTPEQRSQVEKMRAEKSTSFKKGHRFKKEGRKGEKGKMARKGGEDRRAAMVQQLNLTTEQQAKMKEAQTAFRSQMQSLRNDKALNEEQKRAKVKELAQQHQAQVQSILTKEQQEKMEQIRKERPTRSAK